METYPRAAVERAMKVQEVILRAVAKKITLLTTEQHHARAYSAVVVEPGNFELKWLAAKSDAAYDSRQCSASSLRRTDNSPGVLDG
jgi:hypothetical protein